jgi:hydroxymethylglutaryl-CoA reductase (NADPH)
MIKETNFPNIIPSRLIGPVSILFDKKPEDIMVPLATFESPLWYSVDRGAKISKLSGGIKVSLLNQGMTRSVILEADSLTQANNLITFLEKKKNIWQKVAEATSKFLKLKDWHFQIVGNLIYLRFSFFCGEASGHNMSTRASQAISDWILKNQPQLKYVSISGNYCTDKKVSAVNSILGRGRNVNAEIKIKREICEKILHVLPEEIVALNNKKNLLGSILAGSIASANAHFGNMLLAFYLATGQDAANIVEGSQGITYANIVDGDLYFSVTLPNIIVGSVGSGKDLDFAEENLTLLGCNKNADRLASIAGAVVLCGELSLLGALANSHELISAHLKLERKKRSK